MYIIPATGGVPQRLTWHPAADMVRDFTPDGKKVLFISPRNSFTNRYAQLYTVDLVTGAETPLPIPNANWTSYSADGNYIALYTKF